MDGSYQVTIPRSVILSGTAGRSVFQLSYIWQERDVLWQFIAYIRNFSDSQIFFRKAGLKQNQFHLCPGESYM